MKYFYLLLSLFFSLTSLAQTGKIIVTGTDKKLAATQAADLKKMFNVTDKTIYDTDGNVVDSAMAVQMVKSLTYQLGLSVPKGQQEYKRTITKIDPVMQLRMYDILKRSGTFKPKGANVQEGVTLNLKPLTGKIATDKLEGKALILIFWCKDCYSGPQADAYCEINEITSAYADPVKLQVMAITHHPYDEAIAAEKKDPILNAFQIFDAEDVTKAYQTDDRPLVILTDRNHKIIYAAAQHAMITPWMLNKLLKENLN